MQRPHRWGKGPRSLCDSNKQELHIHLASPSSSLFVYISLGFRLLSRLTSICHISGSTVIVAHIIAVATTL